MAFSKLPKYIHRKHSKIAVFDNPVSFGASSPENPREYRHEPYIVRK